MPYASIEAFNMDDPGIYSYWMSVLILGNIFSHGHFRACQSAQEHQLVEAPKMSDAEGLAGKLRQSDPK